MTASIARKRVLVTRAAHQAGKLSDGLRAAGLEPVEVPVLEILPPVDCGPLDAALKNLKAFDWLVLTSANTARAIEERAASLGIALTGPLVAAVGEATAMAARKAGLEVAVVPENYVAESLIASLSDRAGSKRILLARAEVARDVIPDAMRSAGAVVDVVDAYRNVMPDSAPLLLRAALEKGIDAATFTSSSSVTHLADAARAAKVLFPFEGVPAVSIGPITSGTLREYGWEPAVEASPSDIGGLIAAVLSLYPTR